MRTRMARRCYIQPARCSMSPGPPPLLTMSTTIIIQDLVKTYPAIAPQPGQPPTTTAVDQVSLTINPGELFFLLGPSGCGKTTLLRMIAGFIEPTRGRIFFRDTQGAQTDVTFLPAEKRDTGMVFQSYALWPHMTVAQNVGFGLEVRGFSAKDRGEKVREALARVRMEQYSERKPNQLSGGQQQRVALARAMVIRPRVLLLDEPLSNLDAKLRLELRSEIRALCKQAGITGIYVTHDQKEALSMADRMAIMRAGKIEQVGDPVSLYRRPHSRFVTEFLGDANLFPGTISRIDGLTVEAAVSFGALRGFWSHPDVKPTTGLKVLVCVRPESFGRTGQDNVIRGSLVESTYLGDIRHETLRTQDGSSIAVATLNPRVAIDSESDREYGVAADDVIVIPDA